MAEHRERVDQRMSREVVKRVIVPLCLDLGARYLRRPTQKDYDDEEKTLKVEPRLQEARRQAHENRGHVSGYPVP